MKPVYNIMMKKAYSPVEIKSEYFSGILEILPYDIFPSFLLSICQSIYLSSFIDEL